MKFFIVGRQCSNKSAVTELCADMGMRAGHEFTNLPRAEEKMYIDPQYELLTQSDIKTMFECSGYLCVSGISQFGILDSFAYHRGISFYEYDNSDVLALTPSQVCKLNSNIVNDDIVWVWMDNTYPNRLRVHTEEHRKYSFHDVEVDEEQYLTDFAKYIYNFKNSSVLYFLNEVPERVATIIYSIYKHSDLLPLYTKNFN